MVSRLDIFPKALEDGVTSQNDASLTAIENGRDCPKTLAAATSLQEGVIIRAVSYILMMAVLVINLIIVLMMMMTHFLFFPLYIPSAVIYR